MEENLDPSPEQARTQSEPGPASSETGPAAAAQKRSAEFDRRTRARRGATAESLPPAGDAAGEDEPEGETEGEAEETPRHARPLTILIAIGVGLVGTIAIGWFIISEQVGSFTGSERVSELLESANGLNGDEFEPVNTSAKDLEDYFFLKHGLERYGVPKELGDLKTVGCRVARFEGSEVAEIMAIGSREMLLFLFHPKDLGVKVKPGRWEIIQGDEWVGGLNGDKDVCCLISFRGNRDDMKAFLRSKRL
ncbi:MAG: hypothetical protein JO069_19030 [Verrucomicrobia bacterium]|nr:hypothetical protein [Verrucomicrobiota bacterium]